MILSSQTTGQYLWASGSTFLISTFVESVRWYPKLYKPSTLFQILSYSYLQKACSKSGGIIVASFLNQMMKQNQSLKFELEAVNSNWELVYALCYPNKRIVTL